MDFLVVLGIFTVVYLVVSFIFDHSREVEQARQDEYDREYENLSTPVLPKGTNKPLNRDYAPQTYETDSGTDFATSMAVGMATGNPLLGIAAGGDITGAFIGAEFNHSNDSYQYSPPEESGNQSVDTDPVCDPSSDSYDSSQCDTSSSDSSYDSSSSDSSSSYDSSSSSDSSSYDSGSSFGDSSSSFDSGGGSFDSGSF